MPVADPLVSQLWTAEQYWINEIARAQLALGTKAALGRAYGKNKPKLITKSRCQ